MRNECTVHTTSGILHGEQSQQGRLRIFRGVPYAYPPVGDLRFCPPVPVEKPEKEIDATHFAPISIQRAFLKGSFYQKEFYLQQPLMSEDSLYLNVWAPVYRKNLPVAIWIHGGGYMAGYAYEKEFNPEALAAMGVVVVIPAYRLGILGFLSHEWIDDKNGLSGNYGLMDLALAIRWIVRNISAFGGDPQRITVMGQSAGARLAQMLTVCPSTRKLIQRAVFQSGGGIEGPIDKHELSAEEAKYRNEEFLNYLNVRNLDQLRQIPAKTLQLACNAAQNELGLESIYFCPVLDGQWISYNFHGDDAIIEPSKSVLIGSNAGDFGSLATAKHMQDACSRYGQKHGDRTWQYLFARKLPGDQAGAFHSAELWYVFGNLGACWRPFTMADKILSNLMMAYWVNFIRDGNPNQAGLPPWKHCRQQGETYLQLDSPIAMIEGEQ